MKKLYLLIGAVLLILLSACGNGSETSQAAQKTKEDEENWDRIEKILDNAAGTPQGEYEDLPTDVRQILNDHPDMLKEFMSNPSFMSDVSMAGKYLSKVETKDIKYMYNHKNFRWLKVVPYGNGEEPPAKKHVVKRDMIIKLENN